MTSIVIENITLTNTWRRALVSKGQKKHILHQFSNSTVSYCWKNIMQKYWLYHCFYVISHLWKKIVFSLSLNFYSVSMSHVLS